MSASRAGKGNYLAGEGFFCSVPRLWQPGRSRLIVSVRGAGGDHSASANDVRRTPDRGIPCIEADYGKTSGGRWGTDDSNAKITAAWQYMIDQFGVVSDKLVFAVGSGGLIDALNWVKANPGKCAAIGSAVGAISLTDIHDNNRDGRQVEIETVYGGLAAYNAVKTAKNPPDNASAFRDVAMRLVYSADDPICLASITEAFAASVGSNVLLENVGNHGHSLGPSYDSTVHVRWLDQHVL